MHPTTLCWFRNRLINHHRLDAHLAIINRQIQAHGLMVKGAMIDTTLIESAARPPKMIRGSSQPNLKMAHLYGVNFDTGRGTVTVGIKVKEFKDGNRYYDHFELKKKSPT